MNIFHAIIIDQESNEIEELKQQLLTHHPEIIIEGTATDINDGLNLIKQFKPQIVFFAIYEYNQESAQTLEQFVPCNFKLVLIVSKPHFNAECCNLSPVKCIIKPILTEQLNKAIELCKLARQGHSMKRLLVDVGVKSILVELKNIVCIVGDKSYSKIIMINEASLLSKLYLNHYENVIISHYFLQAHRSSLINMRYFKAIDHCRGGEVEMTNGLKLHVSEKGHLVINDWLKKYLY